MRYLPPFFRGKFTSNFLAQCGPVVNVHVPKDKLTQQHMGFGFVEFKSEQDAEYAIKVRMPAVIVCLVIVERSHGIDRC